MNNPDYKRQSYTGALTFEKMSARFAPEVMAIFNYYAENSFAAYPEKKMPVEFYHHFLEMTKGYPAYVIKTKETIVGFGFLRAYNPFPVFNETAEITYFVDKDYLGQGIGKQVLETLERDAVKMGIQTILASITSINVQSVE